MLTTTITLTITVPAPSSKLAAAVKRKLEPLYLQCLEEIAEAKGLDDVDALLQPFLTAPARGPVPLGPIRSFVVAYYRSQMLART